ncbi:MAG TPA: hypothetical protein VFT22_13295 [Kofleriaceae bacterium]|nr:hypothetical protein [Kofleriaceae bacterium]
MSPRRLAGLTAIHVLLLVALLEVAINRVAVPMLRPAGGPPPWWHTYLDYIGLFLFYFAGTLAALVLAVRCWRAVFTPELGLRNAYGLVAVTTALAATPLVVDAPPALSLALEISFAASVIALGAAAFGRRRDVGIQIGLPIVAVPLLMHSVYAIGAQFLWPDSTFDGPGVALVRAGVVALSLAALATPYCFAPRPLSRSVTRPAPVLVAMVVAGIGALLARASYPALAKAASLAIGVELTSGQPDPRLAMYLLAVATLAWTLASCARAASPARRSVGGGLALIVLGGYAFRWPHHYLLPLLGLALIADAVRSVRDEELAAMPISSETPPIADAAWSAYVTQVTQGLRRALDNVHSLTTRGEGGLASSVIIGDAGGIAVRVRVERIEGCVLALDVVLGREIDELRAATLTAWAIPPRSLGINPAGPPAAPPFKTGDPQFDERFKTRGSALAFHKLFDEGLRARTVAAIDGWIAYWDSESLRYRVYPGRGAPLDHPMPLSDLALGRPSATPDRLVAVIELLVELAARGVHPQPASEAAPEPAELT